jgi:hypothetical protein
VSLSTVNRAHMAYDHAGIKALNPSQTYLKFAGHASGASLLVG